MESLVYISEDKVRELLNWDKTFQVIERAMESVAKDRAFQKARAITEIPNSPNALYTMPGYLSDDKYGALGCKLVTYFPNNVNRSKPLPNTMASLLLMDDETGALKAVVAGTEITTARTAAASAVATKYLHPENNDILAIMGAGTQGRIHAICLQHFFNFREVRIWNHRPERAKSVVAELNQGKTNKGVFVAYENAEKCVRNADVIVTATSGGGDKPIVKFEWLKKGVHINAIAVNQNNLELEEDVYKNANVYIDYWDGARNELPHIQKLGVEFKGQIGDLIVGKMLSPNVDTTTVFQSLGMAVEDCAMARLIYDTHMGKYFAYDMNN